MTRSVNSNHLRILVLCPVCAPTLKTHPSSWLADAYFHGTGVENDRAAAEKWWLASAEKGYLPSQMTLGERYFKGDGLEKNPANSFKWYLKAAVQGDKTAQGWVGWFYQGGEGVKKDVVLGYAWSNLAASGGSKTAIENRDMIERLLSSSDQAEGQRLSSEWRKGTTITRTAMHADR